MKKKEQVFTYIKNGIETKVTGHNLNAKHRREIYHKECRKKENDKYRILDESIELLSFENYTFDTSGELYIICTNPNTVLLFDQCAFENTHSIDFIGGSVELSDCQFKRENDIFGSYLNLFSIDHLFGSKIHSLDIAASEVFLDDMVLLKANLTASKVALNNVYGNNCSVQIDAKEACLKDTKLMVNRNFALIARDKLVLDHGEIVPISGLDKDSLFLKELVLDHGTFSSDQPINLDNYKYKNKRGEKEYSITDKSASTAAFISTLKTIKTKIEGEKITPIEETFFSKKEEAKKSSYDVLAGIDAWEAAEIAAIHEKASIGRVFLNGELNEIDEMYNSEMEAKKSKIVATPIKKLIPYNGGRK